MTPTVRVLLVAGFLLQCLVAAAFSPVEFDPSVSTAFTRQQFALELSEDSFAEILTPHFDVLAPDDPNLAPAEFSALSDLYISTGGDGWNWSNLTDGIPWNFTADANPCRDNWQGVVCVPGSPGQDELHLYKLDLSNHELRGTLPPSLGNLTYIQQLALFHNKINGSLPDSLGNLWRITYFDISNNRITGGLPQSFYNLTFMNTLFVGGNRLAGSIPTVVQYYRNLTRLGLAENRFVGSIPDLVCNFPRLQFLDLSNNKLVGSIPSNIGDLSQLKFMWLSNNSLTGTLPESVTQLTQIQYLYMNDNNITGPIPAQIGNLNQLLFLDMDNNEFTGTIPTSVAELRKLFFFGAYENQLVGTIPDFVCDLVRLRQIFLYSNMLTGTIPSCIGRLSEMLFLYLQLNQLHGTIPETVANMSRLNALYLYSNYLSGTLPVALGNLTSLQYLYLQTNALTGTIPPCIGTLPDLLAVLLFQNQLEGSLEGVFDPVLQTELTTLQLSDNQLTGTLPDAIFQLPALSTFVAVSNCFHGKLKESMCGATNLIALALDGLQSASSCRRELLPGISSSYLSDNSLKGRVPECLFSMPLLNTLHLSGNGLTGSLSADLQITEYLTDLSLSHNVLTGNIPQAIQERDWYNLDLSYNRFTGSLRLSAINTQVNFTYHVAINRTDTLTIVKNATSSALALENNRISGAIPKGVLTMLNVSILNGNLFSCKFDKSNLPKHDPNKVAYDCASNSFAVPYYIWMALVGAVALLVTFLLTRSLRWQRFLSIPNIRELLAVWLEATVVTDNILSPEVTGKTQDMPALALAFAIYEAIVKISVVSTAYILVVLLPLYCVLSHYYGTHLHQYAWSVSMAFLSGRNPFAYTTALLLVFLFLVIVAYQQYTKPFLGADTRTLSRAVHSVRLTTADDIARASTASTLATAPLQEVFYVHVAFISVNFLTVLGVNVAFVYVVLYESTALLVLAQILLSFFKVGWNMVCSRYIIRYIVYYFSPSSRRVNEATGDYFAVQLFVALFNNIAIPCVVVSVISPNCFYNLFDPAAPVHSKYDYLKCQLQSFSECVLYVPQIASTSYNPPFTYSYQCSSSFVTYYAPAFVYLCITVTVLTPALMMTLARLHKCATPGTAWYRCLDTVLPRIWKPVHALPAARKSGRAPDGATTLSSLTSGTALSETSSEMSAYQPFPPLKEHPDGADRTSAAAGERCTSSDVEDGSFDLLHKNSAYNSQQSLHSSLTTNSHSRRDGHTPVEAKLDPFQSHFDANLVLVTLLTLLGILLTFGALFPPLAVALLITILAVVYLSKLKIGRFLTQARAENRPDLALVIEKECRSVGSTDNVVQSVWLLILFCCWFYSLFLFDTLGDAVGFKHALWVLVVMALMPFIIYGLYHFRAAWTLCRGAGDNGADAGKQGGNSDYDAYSVEMRQTCSTPSLGSGAPQGGEMGDSAGAGGISEEGATMNVLQQRHP